MIDIIIPTFHRPTVLQKLVDNIHLNTTVEHKITFVLEPDDTESIKSAKATGADILINKYPEGHTGSANTGYQETNGEFFTLGNDDFNYHKNWDTEVMKYFSNSNAGVVGVNDGTNSGFTAITVVRRKYIEENSGCMDIKNVIYNPGYNHNYADTEFAQTAIKRGVFKVCTSSIIEHMHWAFGKSKKDAVYEKSNATAIEDSKIYQSRQHLWT